MKVYLKLFIAGMVLLLSSCSYVRIVDILDESSAIVFYTEEGVQRKKNAETVPLEVVRYEKGQKIPILRVKKWVATWTGMSVMKAEEFRAGTKDDSYSRTLITSVQNQGDGIAKNLMVIETIPARFVVESIGFVDGSGLYGYSLGVKDFNNYGIISKRSGPNGTTIYEIKILKPLNPDQVFSIGFMGHYKVAARKSM
ncbi:MAG TPA: hypothetical protein PKJ16_10455 [Spirochaetota bacterium]|nr:hypothetical protein [Spirochaetota bacterium]HPU87110.1 hypothetical protein [Spirochaetota bacterium]